MSKERYNQIIDAAYGNYIYNPDYKAETVADLMGSQAGQLVKCPTQEEFINKCKTNPEFSNKWDLKIEERELSLEERMDLCKEKWNYSWNRTINLEDIEWRMNNEWNIPTKLITITYNNETIETYE